MSEEPRKKALIIAISEYNDKQLNPLEFCKNDGEKMYELLKSLGYEISDNHILIGYAEFDKMRNAIYDFFDNRKTKADDTLLFYYSGHGIPISDGNTSLASSEIDYYSPRKKGFSSYDLTNLIQHSNSIRIVEVLDCCYSGAAWIDRGSAAEEDAAKLGTAAIENNARLLQQGEGKCLLAASQATQEAFGLREQGHSIFTYYLLQGLKGNEKSVDSEGNVTPDSLGNYVYKEIVNLPAGKRPKQKPIRKTEASGEIILANYPDLKPIRIEVILALSKLLHDGNIEEFNKKRDLLPTNLLNFSRLNLHKRNLSKANFSNVNMSRADLSNADLDGANLSDANMSKAELEGAYLHEANLSNSDLSGANLSNADLSKANLSNADLSNADLSRANLFQTHFKQTKVISAKFVGSDISRAILDETPLWGAIFEPKEEEQPDQANRIKQPLSKPAISTPSSPISTATPLQTREISTPSSPISTRLHLSTARRLQTRETGTLPKVYGDAPRNGDRSRGSISKKLRFWKRKSKSITLGVPSEASGNRVEKTSAATRENEEYDEHGMEKHTYVPPSSGPITQPQQSSSATALPSEYNDSTISYTGLPHPNQDDLKQPIPKTALEEESLRYPFATFPEKIVVGDTKPLKVTIKAIRPTPFVHPSIAQGVGEISIIVHTDKKEVPVQIIFDLENSGFDVVGEYYKTIYIPVKAEDSKPVIFNLKAKNEGPANIKLEFFQQGTYVGELKLNTLVVATKLEAVITQQQSITPDWKLSKKFPPQADVALIISQMRSNMTGSYEVLLHSEEQGYLPIGSIELQYDPESKFRAIFEDIENTDLPANVIDDSIRAKGLTLYDELFPTTLKELYWKIRDSIESIQVFSKEPWIPWEIIKPWRKLENGTPEEDSFLCERFAFSRWLIGVKPSLKEKVNKVKLVVPSDTKLQNVLTERDWIERFAKSKELQTTVDSSYEEVMSTLREGDYDLIHFSTHEKYQSGNPLFSTIELENGTRIRPENVSGIATTFGQSKPLVFLNACKSGAQGFSLTGIQSWVTRFLDAGASAFIGTLWSVSDESALKFTMELYPQLFGGVSLGEAVKIARNRCRATGDPSWLAYVLFGQPNTKITLGFAQPSSLNKY